MHCEVRIFPKIEESLTKSYQGHGVGRDLHRDQIEDTDQCQENQAKRKAGEALHLGGQSDTQQNSNRTKDWQRNQQHH